MYPLKEERSPSPPASHCSRATQMDRVPQDNKRGFSNRAPKDNEHSIVKPCTNPNNHRTGEPGGKPSTKKVEPS